MVHLEVGGVVLDGGDAVAAALQLPHQLLQERRLADAGVPHDADYRNRHCSPLRIGLASTPAYGSPESDVCQVRTLLSVGFSLTRRRLPPKSLSTAARRVRRYPSRAQVAGPWQAPPH